MQIKYQIMRKHSDAHGEKNDCTVIAAAIAGRLDYSIVHAELKRMGRKDGQGVSMPTVMLPAMENLGLRIDRIVDCLQPNGKYYTPISVGKRFKKGYYICSVNGHVFALVNGKVMDWTEGHRHYIQGIWKVTKPRKKKVSSCPAPTASHT